ncbi:hypothetical protein NDU88_003009 [Pleurodeles waltl]|uniref:Uncharacterized protein n=1 Tax=Pleurodeles waltl TaxID=8319 RepID=A0AAV7UX90_PLEWA|nr:hypothetical protein NDU88_003009 [Pleurodeles waltl]
MEKVCEKEKWMRGREEFERVGDKGERQKVGYQTNVEGIIEIMKQTNKTEGLVGSMLNENARRKEPKQGRTYEERKKERREWDCETGEAQAERKEERDRKKEGGKTERWRVEEPHCERKSNKRDK